MTVTTTAVFNDYAGDGTTTAFALLAYCQTAEQVEALVDDVVQSSAGYTVTGLGDAGGVTVTFDTAPADDTVVRVRRVLPLTQETDTVNNETILQDVLDAAFDRGVMLSQQVQEEVSRAIKVAQGDTAPAFPAAADRIDGQYLAFADDGESIVGVAGVTPGEVAVTSYMEGVLALTTRAALQKELAVVSFSPLSTQFGGVGDGTTDDLVALQACMDYCATIASSGAYRVHMDLGGRAWRVIAGPLVHKAGVKIVNGIGLFSTVAVHTNDYASYYAWVVGEGTLGSTACVLDENTIPGSQTLVTTTSGGPLAVDDLVMIGHSPPVTTLSAGISDTDTTIPVVSTTNFPSVGICQIDSEYMSYVAKGATSLTVRTSTGRGRLDSTAASHSSGAKVTVFNAGHWNMARNICHLPVELNYVQAAPRGLSTGKWSILLRHSVDRIFSSTLGGWLKKITPLKNIGLENVVLIGSTSQGRGGGQEVGYMYRYCDGVDVRSSYIVNCSDAHGLLDTCANGRIEQKMYGKANDSTYDGHYGVSLINGNHWIDVVNPIGRNIYKPVTAWASGIATSLASTYWYGTPRHITVTGARVWNAGTPWDNSHDFGPEIHTWGENITITDTGGADGSGGMSIEGGKNITFRGGRLSRWGRSAIAADGCVAVLGFKVEGVDIGERALYAAGTKLASGINSSVTTMAFTTGNWITDLLNDTTDVMVEIDSEWIKLGTRSVDGVTFTGCTRGMSGTTAASHLAGARVNAKGNAYATPVDIDMSRCKFYTENPDEAPTYLTAAVTNSDVTFPVAETSRFQGASATNPIYVEVEGESAVDSQYPSEWVAVTAASTASGAGNLTVVRGAKGTNAVAHSQYMLLQRGTVAMARIKLDCDGLVGDIIRALVYVRGYGPSEDCAITRLGATWKGAVRCTTYPVVVQPADFKVFGGGGELRNFPYGVRLQGNRQHARNVAAVLDTPDVTGGQVVYVEGDRCVAKGNTADGNYFIVDVAASADKTLVHDNSGQRNGGGAVNNAGSNTSSVNNTTVA